VPAGTLFGSHLPEHNFDLAMFTYVLGVDPHYNVSIFSCGDPSNYGEYCNRNVTKLLKASDHELSDKKRVVLINKADTLMANDVPQIPLFQRATYFVYKSNLKGMVDNASSQGPSWNAENWSKG
jgi:ABC-type transport system substrate-binding protein